MKQNRTWQNKVKQKNPHYTSTEIEERYLPHILYKEW